MELSKYLENEEVFPDKFLANFLLRHIDIATKKEKEIKEKEAINEALKKQIRQVEDKLRKSDQQRRKGKLVDLCS